MSTIDSHFEVMEQLANTPAIASKEDAVAFLGAILMAGINFHPDDNFADYVRFDVDAPTFTPEQCEKMETLLAQCHSHLDEEQLYEVLFAYLNRQEGGEQ